MKWPTWQHSAIAAVVCVVALVLVRRLRPSRRTEAAIPALHELIVICSLYTIWRTAKLLPLKQADGAIERAYQIVDLQNAWHLPTELSLQNVVERWDALGWSVSAYYAVMHVPTLVAFLIWLFWRHRDRYSVWRNALAIFTAFSLFIRFVRVAPPRFIPELGYIDLPARFDMSVYGPVGTGVSPQFAAMPSIHVGWAAVVAFGVIAISNSRWRWLVALHLPLTFLVVSATGHHWWLDGIVAVALLAVALFIDRSGRWLVSQMRTDRGEKVLVLGEGVELRELGDHVVGRSEQETDVGFGEHRGVVVRVAAGDDPVVEPVERLD